MKHTIDSFSAQTAFIQMIVSASPQARTWLGAESSLRVAVINRVFNAQKQKDGVTLRLAPQSNPIHGLKVNTNQESE